MNMSLAFQFLGKDAIALK